MWHKIHQNFGTWNYLRMPFTRGFEWHQSMHKVIGHGIKPIQSAIPIIWPKKKGKKKKEIWVIYRILWENQILLENFIFDCVFFFVILIFYIIILSIFPMRCWCVHIYMMLNVISALSMKITKILKNLKIRDRVKFNNII